MLSLLSSGFLGVFILCSQYDCLTMCSNSHCPKKIIHRGMSFQKYPFLLSSMLLHHQSIDIGINERDSKILLADGNASYHNLTVIILKYSIIFNFTITHGKIKMMTDRVTDINKWIGVSSTLNNNKDMLL